MEFRAKLNMEMKTVDQPGVVTLSFVPVTTGVPQISMTVRPVDAAGLVVGKVCKFTTVEDVEPSN